MTFPATGVLHFLTLTQPWATLMAIDAKRNETRDWWIRFRGWFAIHAAKGFPPECQALCYQEPFVSVLAAAGYHSPADLPIGRVLAVTELTHCLEAQSIRRSVPDLERAFGDYGDGRFAFVTSGVRRLREPYLLRGMQRLQKLPLPILESALIDA